jgi:hypothetical protein
MDITTPLVPTTIPSTSRPNRSTSAVRGPRAGMPIAWARLRRRGAPARACTDPALVGQALPCSEYILGACQIIVGAGESVASEQIHKMSCWGWVMQEQLHNVTRIQTWAILQMHIMYILQSPVTLSGHNLNKHTIIYSICQKNMWIMYWLCSSLHNMYIIHAKHNVTIPSYEHGFCVMNLKHITYP